MPLYTYTGYLLSFFLKMQINHIRIGNIYNQTRCKQEMPTFSITSQKTLDRNTKRMQLS